MLRFLIAGLPILTPAAHAQSADGLRTPLNGSGNIYRIPAAAFADTLSP
jgi:hypothetical protein